MLLGRGGSPRLRHLCRRRRSAMTDACILSLITFLPLVGRRRDPARCALFGKGDDRRGRRAARWIALVTTLATLAAVACCWSRQFDPNNPGFQFVEDVAWFAGAQLPHGRRRHLDAVRPADRLPDADLHRWPAGSRSRRASLEYMIAFLVLETLVIGVFCALDLVLFYIFFEGGLIPMFLIIGIWGGSEPGLRGVQVLPLHAARLGADAGWRSCAMIGIAGTTSHPRADAATRFAPGGADLAVAGLLRLVRGEDADVAGAHLAAGRPRRGADGGLGDPGRHPAEDGRLRLPALLPADVPGGVGAVHAAGLRPRR